MIHEYLRQDKQLLVKEIRETAEADFPISPEGWGPELELIDPKRHKKMSSCALEISNGFLFNTRVFQGPTVPWKSFDLWPL